MKLREYTRDDLSAVLSLFYETVHSIDSEDFSPEQLDAWAPRQPDENEWQERLVNASTFVAEHDGRIVGFGNVTMLGLIDTLYVHKKAQKSGVGGALLMRLIAEAKSRGLKNVQSEVNTRARAFFENHGFAVVREKTKQRGGVDFRTYVVSMDLPEDDGTDE